MFQQWLQDVIALQCSIMRHLKKKASSSSPGQPSEASLTERLCEPKADAKPRAHLDERKPLESLERTPSPDSCSSQPPAAPLGTSPLDDLRPESCAPCKCSATPCTDCRKTNGPAAQERRPPKANGPVDCESSAELRGQQEPELQQRLKPSDASATAASGLANHIGVETIKKEPESKTEGCAQNNVPAAPTIRPLGGSAEQETPKTCTDTLPKSNLDCSLVKMDTSAAAAPAPGMLTHPPHRSNTTTTNQTLRVSTVLLRCCFILKGRK